MDQLELLVDDDRLDLVADVEHGQHLVRVLDGSHVHLGVVVGHMQHVVDEQQLLDALHCRSPHRQHRIAQPRHHQPHPVPQVVQPLCALFGHLPALPRPLSA